MINLLFYFFLSQLNAGAHEIGPDTIVIIGKKESTESKLDKSSW